MLRLIPSPPNINPSTAVDPAEIIGCEHCLTGEDGELLIGAPFQAGEFHPPPRRCRSCGAVLLEGDIVAVGVPYSRQEGF